MKTLKDKEINMSASFIDKDSINFKDKGERWILCGDHSFDYKDVKHSVKYDNKTLEELRQFFVAELDNKNQPLTLLQVIEHLDIYKKQKKEIFGEF